MSENADVPVVTNEGDIPQKETSNGQKTVLVSYLTLRRLIGILGVLLPVLLAVGCIVIFDCSGIEESISAYYGTGMRDVFVGILFTIAWFLFSYKGYERKDDIAGDIGCILALGVALFPTTSESAVIQAIHLISAASLFSVLAYFSIFLFTKTSGSPTAGKKARNKLYVACGVIMLACILLIPLFKVFLTDSAVSGLKPVFCLETLALWAFGLSWMTKGKMLLVDTGGNG